MTDGHERVVLVDASAFITLAAIDRVELLRRIGGTAVMPTAVRDEIIDGPAVGALERGRESGWLDIRDATESVFVEVAREQLGREGSAEQLTGDVATLAHALDADDPVAVTDDQPLRKTCKALSIPVSGSIDVVIAAVERGYLDSDEAKEALVAMDEVGARLSARLLRKAERLIDEAAEGRAE